MQHRRLAKERLLARRALLPLLQAEADRRHAHGVAGRAWWRHTAFAGSTVVRIAQPRAADTGRWRRGRSGLLPVRSFVRNQAERTHEEAEVMKNVPGWNPGASVYHTDRWVSPPPPDRILQH